jgi:hypothetical protein
VINALIHLWDRWKTESAPAIPTRKLVSAQDLLPGSVWTEHGLFIPPTVRAEQFADVQAECTQTVRYERLVRHNNANVTRNYGNDHGNLDESTQRERAIASAVGSNTAEDLAALRAFDVHVGDAKPEFVRKLPRNYDAPIPAVLVPMQPDLFDEGRGVSYPGDNPWQ